MAPSAKKVFLVGMCLSACLLSCKASSGLVVKDDFFSSLKRFVERSIRSVVNTVYQVRRVLPQWVKNCLTVFQCFFDETSSYAKCALYVVKCAIGEVANISTCAYNIASDLAIAWFYNGMHFGSFDYKQLGKDVLKCAGYDLDDLVDLVHDYRKTI